MTLNRAKYYIILFEFLVAVLFSCCDTSGTNNNSMKNNSEYNLTLDEVREIFSNDKNAIIEKYNANGAGIGKKENHYVIRVYVNEEREDSSPLIWKSIPIELVLTSEFKAH